MRRDLRLFFSTAAFIFTYTYSFFFFWLDIRKNLFSERGVLQWHSCPGSGGVTIRGGVQSCGEVALRDVVMGTVGWVGVGLDDLRGLFHPE